MNDLSERGEPPAPDTRGPLVGVLTAGAIAAAIAVGLLAPVDPDHGGGGQARWTARTLPPAR